MFTGLVQAIGEVTSLRPREGGGLRLFIEPRGWHVNLNLGESISVSGVCLTLADGSSPGRLCFDAVPETLACTTLGRLRIGGHVNLERSLSAGDYLGGHFVQGHIEAVGRVEVIAPAPDYRLRISAPAELMPAIVPKGSVAVDGVSLTVAAADPPTCSFEVALIPTTLALTTLSRLRAGEGVNLETDVFARTIVNYMRYFAGQPGADVRHPTGGGR
jgi:riboflavin synthase alpha subunit